MTLPHYFGVEALLEVFFFLPPFLLVRLARFVGVGVGVSGGGVAPLRRIRPSLSVSVMMGLAAGRYLCSLEYLFGGRHTKPSSIQEQQEDIDANLWVYIRTGTSRDQQKTRTHRDAYMIFDLFAFLARCKCTLYASQTATRKHAMKRKPRRFDEGAASPSLLVLPFL